MGEEYTIISVDKPDDSVWEVVGWGIHHYNEQQAGAMQHKQLCFVLRAPDQKVVGGLIGSTYWNWFYIDLLLSKKNFVVLVMDIVCWKRRKRKRENAAPRMCI